MSKLILALTASPSHPIVSFLVWLHLFAGLSVPTPAPLGFFLFRPYLASFVLRLRLLSFGAHILECELIPCFFLPTIYNLLPEAFTFFCTPKMIVSTRS